MSFDPRSETTGLSVGGVKRLSGARGMSDLRYRRGLDFGLTRHDSLRASGVIWKVRLEIGQPARLMSPGTLSAHVLRRKEGNESRRSMK